MTGKKRFILYRKCYEYAKFTPLLCVFSFYYRNFALNIIIHQ